MQPGIPSFLLDVTLDEKFELIEAEFGLTGFAVVVKLFQRIYGGEGYYCEWTNEIALVFSRKNGIGANVVSEIVNATIRRGMFEKTLYEKYHILTSKGIQKRYFKVVGRRNNVKVDERYLVISVDNFLKNANKNGENVSNFAKNVSRNRQSKEEERKENKKESRIERSECPTLPSLKDVIDYCNEIKSIVDPNRFFNYYESNGWKVGSQPMKDWKAAIRTWESREKGRSQEKAPKFANEHHYTAEELDSMIDDISEVEF